LVLNLPAINMEKFPKNMEQPDKNPEAAKKEAYDYDYECLALMEGVFLDQARKNPDVKLIDLDRAMTEMGYGVGINLGSAEKKILQKATLNYKDARYLMLELREKGGFEKIGQDEKGDIVNGDKLFESLTGVRPGAKVEVQFLPFAVYLRCEKSDDFGLLYGTLSLRKDFSWESKLDQIKKIQKILSGYATHFQYSSPDTKVPLILVNLEIYKNRSKDEFKNKIDSTIVHEEQHIINNFFTDALFFDKDSADRGLRAVVDKKLKKEELNEKFGLEDAREDLADYAEKLKKFFLLNAQNEIIAYLKDGCALPKIADLLKQKDGFYNYFGQKRDKLAKNFKSNFGNQAEEFLLFVEKEFYNGYGKEIDSAIGWCEKLMAKYSVQEIAGRLNVVPVWKWGEAAEKMLSAR